MTCAVRAAVHRACCLDAMAHDSASTMCTLWCELMNRAFEAVERVSAASRPHLEALVVIVAADVTLRHAGTPTRAMRWSRQRPSRHPPRGVPRSPSRAWRSEEHTSELQ